MLSPEPRSEHEAAGISQSYRWCGGLAGMSIPVQHPRGRLVGVPAHRARVERQQGVAGEVGGHSLGGGVARLHQLVVAGEDRLGDRIDQIVGQGAACHREIVKADGEAAKKRLHHNVLAIALANKLARIAWSVLAHGRAFETNKLLAAA